MMDYATVSDLLVEQSRRRPDATCVIDGASSSSYRELYDLAMRCATFIGRRVAPSQRVALLLPRSIDALAAYFGAHLAGAVPVFVSERLRSRQVATIVRHADVRLLITNGRFRGLTRDAQLPADGVVDVSSLRGSATRLPANGTGRELATLIYTSGSTGHPKAVSLTQSNLVAGALIVGQYLGLTAQDRTLAALPWSFDYGLNQVLATFAAGGAVIVQRSHFAPDIFRTLHGASATGMAGVPPLWNLLTANSSPFMHQQLPHLRYVTNSGGTLPISTVGRLRSAQGHAEIFLMYGLTEAFRSTYLAPTLVDTKPGSIGKAIPETEIMVLGDDGRPCPTGAVGELVHRGPTVASGYWQDPIASAAVFRPHPFAADSRALVVYSGDYVRADADGDLYFVGRRDEMFKSRGIRTTPSEIEAELLSSGLVADVVVAVAHQSDAEPLVLACIAPADPSVSEADVRAYCRRELPSHLFLHDITWSTSMPTTSTGKTDRSLVREQLLAAIQSRGDS